MEGGGKQVVELEGGGEGWSRQDSCCIGPLCCNHNLDDDTNDDASGDDEDDRDDNDGDVPAPAIAVTILGIKANIGSRDKETAWHGMIMIHNYYNYHQDINHHRQHWNQN